MSSLTTKKAIALAFREILKEKSLSKITINDIAQKSDINRQTFYYHFKDVYDLVEWICLTESDNILKQKVDYSSWQEAFLNLFLLLKQDQSFVQSIYHNVSYDLLAKNIYKLVFPIIYNVVKNKTNNIKIKEEDLIFIADFYKYSFVAIVLKWVEDGMEKDPQEIVNRVSDIVTGTIENAIKSIRS